MTTIVGNCGQLRTSTLCPHLRAPNSDFPEQCLSQVRPPPALVAHVAGVAALLHWCNWRTLQHDHCADGLQARRCSLINDNPFSHNKFSESSKLTQVRNLPAQDSGRHPRRAKTNTQTHFCKLKQEQTHLNSHRRGQHPIG